MNITLSMPQQYVERLENETDATGMGRSEIVRRALDLYFAAKQKEDIGRREA